jgi:hypothetical protein
MEHNIRISEEAINACGIVLLGFTVNILIHKKRMPTVVMPPNVAAMINTTMAENTIMSKGKYCST